MMEDQNVAIERAEPLSSILLPVDDPGALQSVASVVQQLTAAMTDRIERIDLLHVITGTFLADLMRRIDLASGETPSQEEMKALHRQHIDYNVTPLLTQSREMLQGHIGNQVPGQIVRDGDPAKVICSLGSSEDYSTLIMSRRNRTEESAKMIGSVVAGVMHRHTDATIYLVGDSSRHMNEELFKRCLIAVDDSPASLNGVKEAASILSRVNQQIEQVYLVHVLDQSCYYDEDGENCMDASLTGQRALEMSGNLLIDAGVDSGKIKTVIHFGRPGTVLAEEVNNCNATLVFLGRRDRSRMAQVFLGSVCTDIIQNCRDRTLVLTS